MTAASEPTARPEKLSAQKPSAQKTVAQKLQVKPGDVVWISGDAGEERALVGALPDGATETDAGGDASIAVTFVHDREELLARFAADLPSLRGARAVWYLYEKGGRSEVNRDTIMREAGAFGWRANSNVAVDDTWSAVRVRPLGDGEAPVG
ncbi:hypothetical protein GCM10027406_15710 [Leifsonia lichenia]